MAEQIWWPDLPSSVRDDLLTLRSALADPGKAATFRGKLPSSLARSPTAVRDCLVRQGCGRVLEVGRREHAMVRPDRSRVVSVTERETVKHA